MSGFPYVPAVSAAFVLVIALLLPRQTQACSCGVAPGEPFPKSGSTVPGNTKFWLPWKAAFDNLPTDRQRDADRSVPWHAGLGPVVSARDVALAHRIIGPTGETIPFSVSRLEIGRGRRPAYFILTPARSLEPGAHSLRVSPETAGSFEISVNVEPRTLARAPHAPHLEFRDVASPVERNTCVDGFYFPFNATHDGIITVLGLTEDLRPIPDQLAWVSDVFASRDGFVGSKACHSNWDFHRGPIYVHVGTFDIAGNFSGWTAPVQLEVPQEAFDARDKEVVDAIARNLGVSPQSPPGCRCTLLPQHPSTAIPTWLLPCCVLWLRRRAALHRRM